MEGFREIGDPFPRDKRWNGIGGVERVRVVGLFWKVWTGSKVTEVVFTWLFRGIITLVPIHVKTLFSWNLVVYIHLDEKTGPQSISNYRLLNPTPDHEKKGGKVSWKESGTSTVTEWPSDPPSFTGFSFSLFYFSVPPQTTPPNSGKSVQR